MSKTVWADLPPGARLRKLRLVMSQFAHGTRADAPNRGDQTAKKSSSLKQRLDTLRSLVGARL